MNGRHYLRICLAGLMSLSVITPAPAADKKLNPAPGMWQGIGYQVDLLEEDKGEVSTWTVTLTIGPQSVSVAYPSLNCGGVWALERATEYAAYYRETITYGLENCIDQGLAVLSPMDGDRQRIEYYYPDDVFIAVGYLERAP